MKKWTESNVRHLRNMAESGATLYDMAGHFCVTENSVSNVMSRYNIQRKKIHINQATESPVDTDFLFQVKKLREEVRKLTKRVESVEKKNLHLSREIEVITGKSKGSGG